MTGVPPLPTEAERKADAVRNLPAFQAMALGDVRQRVSEMLNLIGRVQGIFSTYTTHDIRHVDAMLRMLDWLIPPSTVQVMTPPDWLMTVLAIYLHDLGMLVTTQEYETRSQNPEFTSWLTALQTTPVGRSYLARTKLMRIEQQDRFFFQEFIRLNHPRRIREWITGRHSWAWVTEIKPIADAVGQTLQALPQRFRDHLAAVCESHHSDKLDKLPLFAPCGGAPSETVNVQYAAIILRTADLLHVTKD